MLLELCQRCALSRITCMMLLLFGTSWSSNAIAPNTRVPADAHLLSCVICLIYFASRLQSPALPLLLVTRHERVLYSSLLYLRAYFDLRPVVGALPFHCPLCPMAVIIDSQMAAAAVSVVVSIFLIALGAYSCLCLPLILPSFTLMNEAFAAFTVVGNCFKSRRCVVFRDALRAV